jgi:hypothetical protein
MQGEGCVVCVPCYEQLRITYGDAQLERREWLMGRLREARESRRRGRDLELRRVAATAGETLEAAAQMTGAALEAAASMSARGLGALASGAHRSAVAAWGGKTTGTGAIGGGSPTTGVRSASFAAKGTCLGAGRSV